ncbi:heparan sulfate glucosamine 3-O-sulfotransferase 3A1-like [Platysternon megacephalum]|uniref:Heparan sulfate glucosamine 3-O-sulfotransferase 3A1-like n=1 Tax=Platysternon megacephalum TaxID=55544 RepID=A0A4D9E5N4_9SAUR|nr:heparan sulfate glucosamine 3-O-sulfotransferase 3A1-like [Platysternon megacephalum]
MSPATEPQHWCAREPLEQGLWSAGRRRAWGLFQISPHHPDSSPRASGESAQPLALPWGSLRLGLNSQIALRGAGLAALETIPPAGTVRAAQGKLPHQRAPAPPAPWLTPSLLGLSAHGASGGQRQ